MTLKYWMTLNESSRHRTLIHVFPGNPAPVNILLSEKPDKNNTLWQFVLREVRIPVGSTHYKTIVHNTYIP